MIDMQRVRQWSRNVGDARQSLFVLDACFSGLVGLEPKGQEDDETLERLRQPAHHLITAGDEGEQSWAAEGKSLFTDAFLRAARGEGDLTGDGLVSLNELMVEVGKLIDQRRNELQDKIKMTPRVWLARTEDNSGEFFFIAKDVQERIAARAHLVRPNTEPKGTSSPSVSTAVQDSLKPTFAIAVNHFIGHSQLEVEVGRSIARIIIQDLQSSGWYVIDRGPDGTSSNWSENPNFVGMPNYDELQTVEAYVSGHVTNADPNGSVTVQFALWDVPAKRQRRAIRYEGPFEQLGKIAHTIADAIYETITGDPKHSNNRVSESYSDR